MASKDALAHVPAWLAGCGGGFLISLAQWAGTTMEDFISSLMVGEWLEAMTVFASFLIGSFFITLGGGIVGFFAQSKTQNRWAIFLIAATITATGTMALPGIKPLLRKLTDIAPISTAHAAAAHAASKMTTQEFAAECQRKTTISSGLKSYFNLEDQRYRVVVGSFERPEDADRLAARVNAEAPQMKAFVGNPQPCNPYFAVVVSPYVSLNEAKKVQERALQLKSVTGAFLSPYPNR